MEADDNADDILKDATSRPIAGCELLVGGMGGKMILERYEDVLATLEEASPSDMLSFTAFVDSTERRIPMRFSIARAVIVGVEDWNEDLRDAARERRKTQQEAGGILGIGLRGL